MTLYKSLLVPAFIMTLLLCGCNKDSNDNKQIEYKKESQFVDSNQMYKGVVVSEKTLPTNFNEVAFERKTIPMFEYMVRKAVDQSEFEHAWNLYGFENKMPSIDIKENNVFFIGVHESGSCPYKIKNVEISYDSKTLTVPLSGSEGACRYDATPRSFVIKMDKVISNEIENVVIVQSGVDTEIPLSKR